MQLCNPATDLIETFAPDPTQRVLLLEDDEQFEQMLKDFLESHYYNVTAVKNGAEGVREVMSGDFTVIVCDMMMPTLPGDMFYRAVERAKPHLCQKFIFITGYKGDAKISEFIKKIDGTMLNKPFHVDDLIETINFVQFREATKAA